MQNSLLNFRLRSHPLLHRKCPRAASMQASLPHQLRRNLGFAFSELIVLQFVHATRAALAHPMLQSPSKTSSVPRSVRTTFVFDCHQCRRQHAGQNNPGMNGMQAPTASFTSGDTLSSSSARSLVRFASIERTLVIQRVDSFQRVLDLNLCYRRQSLLSCRLDFSMFHQLSSCVQLASWNEASSSSARSLVRVKSEHVLANGLCTQGTNTQSGLPNPVRLICIELSRLSPHF